MASGKKKPGTVPEYIRATPKPARTKLREMRACVRKAAPGATESLKWGMPAFSEGKILVMFAAFRNHIGFFPTSSPMKEFAKELSRYTTGKGSIQFPLGQRLPLSLIRRITLFRVRECRGKGGRWRGNDR
jgi:uncharacterized protein YdhG (YjbR/CyaY superfamily)